MLLCCPIRYVAILSQSVRPAARLPSASYLCELQAIDTVIRDDLQTCHSDIFCSR